MAAGSIAISSGQTSYCFWVPSWWSTCGRQMSAVSMSWTCSTFTLSAWQASSSLPAEVRWAAFEARGLLRCRSREARRLAGAEAVHDGNARCGDERCPSTQAVFVLQQVLGLCLHTFLHSSVRVNPHGADHELRRAGRGSGGQRVACGVLKETECNLKYEYGVGDNSCVGLPLKDALSNMNWVTNARGFADPAVARRVLTKSS